MPHREDLPAEVMDVAVWQHHACIRKLAIDYGGYESNTEVWGLPVRLHSVILPYCSGLCAISPSRILPLLLQGDAFILSFWTAADAVNFCAAVQEAFLHIPWPEELLALPQCRPIWIIRT